MPTSTMVKQREMNARPALATISLVVPCYCESENIAAFMRQIDDVLKEEMLEIIFVNDGSTDDTLDHLVALSLQDTRITVIDLTRNFGKEAALTAGIDYATGDALVPIDVDLQDPPSVILDMIAKWREGYNIVNAVRIDRKTDTIGKRASANMFYRLFNRLAEVEMPSNVGDFRLLDRRVVDAIKSLPERNRFMKGLYNWVGYESAVVEYVRPARTAGKTSFNYWKLWNFALDGFIGFSTVPLRIWTYIGSAIAFLALIFGSLLVFETLVFGRDVPGYPSLMTAILFFGGVQLISLGVIGEYIARLFVEVKARPVYIVGGLYGKQSAPDPDV